MQLIYIHIYIYIYIYMLYKFIYSDVDTLLKTRLEHNSKRLTIPLQFSSQSMK